MSLAPRPTTEQLLEAYSDTYYGPGDTKFIAPIESVIDYFRAQRSRRISRMLPAAGRVLDIGCGNGRFLRYLAKRGFEAHGIELPGKAADRASEVRGLHIHVGESGSIDFPSNSFDIVTMWHVLEHLTEPKVTLERVFRWLTPGGRLVLSLPNVDSWQSHVFKGRWLHHDPPRHLVYLGPKALTRNLAEIGFSVAGESYFSLEQNPFGLQQSLLNCFLARRDALLKASGVTLPRSGGEACCYRSCSS